MTTIGFRNLKVYQLAYKMSMEIFNVSRSFPKSEIYSLTDQIRRSSRSVCTNIAEAYRKRRYPKHFVSKITDADAENSETLVWLEFSKDCKYIDLATYESLASNYQEIGKMLGSMAKSPEKFILK